jgi:hypothetical protein
MTYGTGVKLAEHFPGGRRYDGDDVPFGASCIPDDAGRETSDSEDKRMRRDTGVIRRLMR